MNPMKENMEIVDDIMNAVTQNESWVKIQQTDPMVKEAEDKLDACLDKLKGVVADDLIEELWDAALNLSCAYDYPSILYGVRVAQALHATAQDPVTLSRHIMERKAAIKKEAASC